MYSMVRYTWNCTLTPIDAVGFSRRWDYDDVLYCCLRLLFSIISITRIHYRKQTALNQETSSYSVCLFKQPKPALLKLESPGDYCYNVDSDTTECSRSRVGQRVCILNELPGDDKVLFACLHYKDLFLLITPAGLPLLIPYVVTGNPGLKLVFPIYWCCSDFPTNRTLGFAYFSYS